MKATRVAIVLVAGITCLALGGCPRRSTPTVSVTIAGGNVECALGNVRLSNAVAAVTTTSGQTLVSVSVQVHCVSGQFIPMPGVTLSFSGPTPLTPSTLGPTDENGFASGNFTSTEPATAVVGQTVELRVVGTDGTGHSTSPPTMVTVASQ